MTLEQLTKHFGDQVIYRFDGTVDALTQMQHDEGSSFNYVISQDVIYFVADKPVTDSRATAVTQ